MIRLLYNALFPLALLFFLPGYLLKMRRRGNYRRNFGQRLGIYGSAIRRQLAANSWTWMHAVSVGEVAIALKLANEMRLLDPSFHCALTTTTTTGFAVATKESNEWMAVLYHPLDFWPIVRRAFAVIRPKRIVLVEAEVWPNLVAEARARSVPVALVNARLSERSERRFRRARRFVAPTFRCLDLVCVPEARDIDRWVALGVDRLRIRHVGSIKFDPLEARAVEHAPAADVLRAFGIQSDRPILIGGSTHAGEEEILADVFLRLRCEFPALVLIIAPRHVERTDELQRMLEGAGLSVALRSDADQPSPRTNPDCLLLNTTGELRDWYRIATVVFVGKSLTTHGGQNPVEAIVAGKPVLFGPHMENFHVLARALLRHAAAVETANAEVLEREVAALLRAPAVRIQMVANAQAVLEIHRGATRRTAELLGSLG